MFRLILVLLLAVAACSGKQTPAPTSPAAAPDDRSSTEPLTATSLVAYLERRFAAEIEAGKVELDFGSGVEAEIVDELRIMGIDTVGELAAIVPADYHTKGLEASGKVNAAGLTRDLMIIHDVRGYFTKAWQNKWVATPEDFPGPQAYGVDIEVMGELGVFDGDGDGDGEWDGDE